MECRVDPAAAGEDRERMTEATPTTDVTGARRVAATVFAYLAALLVLGVIVQFFLAGVGVFGVDQHKIDDASSLDPHRALGHILAGVAILMFVAALVARTSRAAISVSIVIALLSELVQTALASGGVDHHWLGGLHALDGVIILGLAGWMHRISRERLKRG
jgi:small-conductance mechanosensitive channel